MNRLTLLESILDCTDLICYVSDYETYELIYMNRAVKATVGVDENDESYVGKKCYELLQGNRAPCSYCTNRFLKPGENYKWENYNMLLRKYFDLKDTMLIIDGRKLRLEFANDITSNKEELFKLKNKLTVEETLVRCAQTLSGDLDVQSAIYRLLAVVCDFYKADRAYIFESDDGGETISNTYEWCKDGVSPQMHNLQNIPRRNAQGFYDMFEEVGCFFVDNLKHDLDPNSNEYKILQPQGIDRLIAAPLKRDDVVVGFVGVDNPMENVKDSVLLRSISLFIMDDLEKRKAVRDLEKLSFIDNLTGLYNRHKYMNEVLELSNGDGRSVGILYADINGLKKANDDFGHEYGDKLIKKATSLLQRHFSDSTFRIGGDEFVALSYDAGTETFDSRVKNFRTALEKQNEVSMSLGYVWCADSRDINQHIAYADEFMYIDKQNYYKNSLGVSKKYRATVATDLLESINNKNFIVFLQPKVKLSDGKIVGAEALIRKVSENCVIEPYKFMYVYEKTGLISYLDMFVLETVCKQIREWKRQGYKTFPVSVNFSRNTVMEYNIAEKIKSVCDKYEVMPENIMIEITEHVGNIKGVALAEVLKSIQKMGFRISLDDFGSEYSSIAVLSEIHFDEIKFDKSLVDKIRSNGTSRAILKHLIGLCNSLKDTCTIVEGIETEEQLKILLKYNCKQGQGYFFSRPLSIKDFTLKYLDAINR